MPRLKSYWSAKANAMMTPDQLKATAERYAEWQHDRDLNSKARWNAACVERARQWALNHPEEAKERRRKARETRKARRMADPAYAAHHREIRKKHKAQYRSTPSGSRCIRACHLKPLGWTIDRYDIALHEQGNRCAICQETFTATPHADHQHVVPPMPRGLLCNVCNSLIGFAKDNPAICEAAATYLRHWNNP
jgi:Recombination endonuclease VII